MSCHVPIGFVSSRNVARYSFVRISHEQSHCQVGKCLVSSRLVALSSIVKYCRVALSGAVP